SYCADDHRALHSFPTRRSSDLCKDARIDAEAHAFATPRRLTLLATLAQSQKDLEEVRTGPPMPAAFRDGQPTKAASGFAAGQGVDRKSTRLNSSHVKISYAVFC